MHASYRLNPVQDCTIISPTPNPSYSVPAFYTRLPTMADYLPKLSQSKPKSEFFRHLGWSENDERHKRLYAAIMVYRYNISLICPHHTDHNSQEEAAAGRARTCQSRDNLTPQTRHDQRVSAPYSSAMITETARHREVQSIYVNSSIETRAVYDRGAFEK